jgi:hypothetical protein
VCFFYVVTFLLSLCLSKDQGLPGNDLLDEDEDDFDLRELNPNLPFDPKFLDGLATNGKFLADLETDPRYAVTLVSSSFTKLVCTCLVVLKK